MCFKVIEEAILKNQIDSIVMLMRSFFSLVTHFEGSLVGVGASDFHSLTALTGLQTLDISSRPIYFVLRIVSD